jgi:dihydroxy-acid dehydratase
MGDGRQSGTSASPSILHVTPEAARGEGLALLRTGDRLRIDLKACRVDLLLPAETIEQRRTDARPLDVANQTPWEEIYRKFVGELGSGGCLELATCYLDIVATRGEARHNH